LSLLLRYYALNVRRICQICSVASGPNVGQLFLSFALDV
jgi:hypothetical protein